MRSLEKLLITFQEDDDSESSSSQQEPPLKEARRKAKKGMPGKNKGKIEEKNGTKNNQDISIADLVNLYDTREASPAPAKQCANDRATMNKCAKRNRNITSKHDAKDSIKESEDRNGRSVDEYCKNDVKLSRTSKTVKDSICIDSTGTEGK